ncbi:16S rRNA (cytosine(1402)-N(4))-methyltransferase [bacterium]|nr:16S rRNA (cytosine(1402)-N(4))-methyltransferase [bacterium]
MDDNFHPSALVPEVVGLFAPLGRGARILDATVGHGGHAEALLHAGFNVLGVDLDERALAVAAKRLAGHLRLSGSGPRGAATVSGGGAAGGPLSGNGRGAGDPSLTLLRGRFGDLCACLEKVGWGRADGLLADLGVRLDQLQDPGCSLEGEGSPDMRLAPGGSGRTALDILLSDDGPALARLFGAGGVRSPRRLAHKVLAARRAGDLDDISCRGLARLLAEPGRRRQHPATRPFLALRRAVNDEEGQLRLLLASLPRLLAPGGIAALIAWHSAEDGPVKRALGKLARMGQGTLLTDRPIRPTAVAAGENPRARSARLRAIQLHRLAPTLCQEGTSP